MTGFGYRLLCMDILATRNGGKKGLPGRKMEKAEEGGWEYYATALALASLYITGNRKEAALTASKAEKEAGRTCFYLEYMVREENGMLSWSGLRWMAPAVRNASPGVIERSATTASGGRK